MLFYSKTVQHRLPHESPGKALVVLGCDRSRGRHGQGGTNPCAYLGCPRLTSQGARWGWSSGEAQHQSSIIPAPQAVLPEGPFSVTGSADLGVVSPLAAFSLLSAKRLEHTHRPNCCPALACNGLNGQHPRHRGSQAACSPAGDSYRFGRGLFNSISVHLHQAMLAPKPHQTSQFLPTLSHQTPQDWR